jgi:hypothetical protein
MAPETRNTFISFHIADEAQVNLLRAQAKSDRFELAFRDFSVKEPFDSLWKQQCKDKIAQTSATICMIGEGTHQREAVEWELETSYELGHKVFGVRIYRDSDHSVPKALVSRSAPILPWNIESIVAELESRSLVCAAPTKVISHACRRRVASTPPCWQHKAKVAAGRSVSPPTTVEDLFSQLVKPTA